MNITVEDIARHAGVGRSTAYRVLCNQESVSSEARSKVLCAVDELGYPHMQPKRGKPRNARQQSRLVLWDRFSSETPLEIFFPEVRRGLEKAMEKRRKALQTIQTPAVTEIEDLPIELLQEDIGGILTVAFYNKRCLSAMAMRWPVVNLLMTRPNPGAHSLGPDYTDAGRQAVEHLLTRGHERIGLMIGVTQEQNFSRIFLEGYWSSLMLSGKTIDASLVHSSAGNLRRLPGDDQKWCGCAGAHALLNRPPHDRPTALIARKDSLKGILTAAEELGLSIPEDLSLIIVDVEEGERDPDLTVITFSADEMADFAVTILGSAPSCGARMLLPMSFSEGKTVRTV